jgi:hypothetical protein
MTKISEIKFFVINVNFNEKLKTQEFSSFIKKLDIIFNPVSFGPENIVFAGIDVKYWKPLVIELNPENMTVVYFSNLKEQVEDFASRIKQINCLYKIEISAIKEDLSLTELKEFQK